MSYNAGEVYALLGARMDPAGFLKFDAAMKESRRTMEESEKRMAAAQARSSKNMHALGTAAKVGAGAGILALAGIIGGAVKVSADFDAQMRNVNSIAKLNEGQFKALSTQVNDLAGKTAQAPKTLAAGMYQLVSSGFDAGDSLTILKSAAVAASAGLTDTETSITAVAGVLNAYHEPASRAQQVSDDLFQTVNRGVITFPQLAQTIGTVLPFAAKMGINLKQVGASISTLTKEGIPAAEATTYLKNAMVSFLKPNKDLQAAIKSTGFESGEALVKQKGFQGALEALAKTTDGTSAGMKKLFPDIRASAAVFALTGKNAKTAEADVKGFGDTGGASQKVFAEQMKSTKMQTQQFLATIESVGVKMGAKFLPHINNGIKALGHWVQQMDRSGQLNNFADNVVQGGQTAIGVLHGLYSAAVPLVHVLTAVGGALNLGDAHNILAIIAAFAGFKVAETVAPMVAKLGTSIMEVAGTAPSLAAASGDILAMVNPYTAVALGVGALAGAFVLLGGHESLETGLANANAAAKRQQAAAIRSVQDAELEAADAGLASKAADVQHRKDVEALAEAKKKYGKDSPQYKDALLTEEQSSLRAAASAKKYTDEIKTQNKANDDRIKKSKGKVDAARESVKDADSRVAYGEAGPNKAATPADLKLQAEAHANLTHRVQEYVQAQARASVSDESRQRLMKSASQITEKNAMGISLLTDHLKGVPPEVRSRLLVQDQDALSKLGNVMSQMGKVPARRVTRIFTETSGAKAATLAFSAIVAGVPSRKVSSIVARLSGKAETAALNKEIAKVKSKNAKVSAAAQGAKDVKNLHKEINDLPKSKAPRISAPGASAAAGQVGGLKSAIGDLKALDGTTINIHVKTTGKIPGAAMGRGPQGKDEVALVGEGRNPNEHYIDPARGIAFKITQPMLLPVSPTASIIPEDPAYRGRALGLLKDVANDMGVNMYKKGKGPKRKIPPKKNWIIQDPDEVDKNISALSSQANQKVTKGKNKGKLTKAALRAKALMKRWKSVRHEVHKLTNRVQKDNENADYERSRMEYADKIDDQAMFDEAKKNFATDENDAKQTLEKIWTRMTEVDQTDTKYGRNVRQQIQDLKGKLIDAQQTVYAAADAQSGAGSADQDAINQQAVQNAYNAGVGDRTDFALSSVLRGAGDVGTGSGAQTLAAMLGQPQIVQNINTLHPGDPAVHAAVAASAAQGFSQQPSRVASKEKALY